MNDGTTCFDPSYPLNNAPARVRGRAYSDVKTDDVLMALHEKGKFFTCVKGGPVVSEDCCKKNGGNFVPATAAKPWDSSEFGYSDTRRNAEYLTRFFRAQPRCEALHPEKDSSATPVEGAHQ